MIEFHLPFSLVDLRQALRVHRKCIVIDRLPTRLWHGRPSPQEEDGDNDENRYH